ncbi:MAG: RagB/SusD family nutrient uptake outer membrane protein [Longimicrobiales bacterium]
MNTAKQTLSRIPALVFAAVLAAGCDTDFMIPDLNNPGLETLEQNPTRAAVIDATQGLMIGARAGMAAQTGYVAHLGILGRESITFDNSDPRYIDEMLAGALDPGNGAFGGSGWAPRYANLRNASIVLNALDQVSGFSAAELEAIRGFAKTIQALDFLIVVNMRDVNGAVIDVNRPLDAELAPFVSKAEVFAHIVDLLDEADAHLSSGGGSFPFQLTSGFTGFATPAAFRSFNRALRARVDVYMENYASALTSLTASFFDPAGPLDLGVYHAFGTGSGDVANGLFQGSDPQIVAHPSARTAPDRKPDGSLDDRVAAKTAILDPPQTDASGVASDVRFTIYEDLASPVPIIRNEELTLLRAEARWFTGDRAGAIADLNSIRQRSGGLPPIAVPATDDAFITELLEQRWLSLMLEGGHRWLDHRRFGRLDQLPRFSASETIPSAFPIPRNECVARGLSTPCGF